VTSILEVIALVRSEIERHRVSLQTHLSSDVPRVLGDRVQLQQVLLNLLMNGIEALSGVNDWARELRISSGTHASHAVLVAVQDSSIGIDPEHVDRLFNAFFTTKPSGMGLGLAISRSIIEAHDGTRWSGNAGRSWLDAAHPWGGTGPVLDVVRNMREGMVAVYRRSLPVGISTPYDVDFDSCRHDALPYWPRP
jgi:signal transduction histidine kinase